MPNGGRLTITTTSGTIDEAFIATRGFGKVGRYAVISVIDSGTGMDEQTKQHVFDPFFTTKEIGKGTGLGLSMAMGIIIQHDGFMDLFSKPGTGTAFDLYLPLVDEVVPENSPFHYTFPAERCSGTILIAEDDENTRNALAEFLTRVGYTVISAIDGQDAVEKFAARADEIELVISDVVMPRQSGRKMRDEIRKLRDGINFIFISGYSHGTLEKEGHVDHDAELVMKPILPFELLKRIRGITGKHEANSE